MLAWTTAARQVSPRRPRHAKSLQPFPPRDITPRSQYNLLMGAKRKSPAAMGWGACKRVLADWPRPGVVALVQELYRLSEENRRYLHARLLTAHAGESLAAAVKAVQRLVSQDVVYREQFRHGDVKRVIDQFAKASDEPAAVARLLMEDLAASLETFGNIGDFEPIVDHIYATMNRLDQLIGRVDAADCSFLASRLDQLAERWADRFGYGISDELVGMALDWRQRFDLEHGRSPGQ